MDLTVSNCHRALQNVLIGEFCFVDETFFSDGNVKSGRLLHFTRKRGDQVRHGPYF